MPRYVVTLAVCGLLTVSTDASAQMREWTDQGYANINFGFEAGGGTLEGSRDFVDAAGEMGRIAVAQDIDSGPFFDISGGARVWRNVSIGLGFHRVSSDGNASIEGSIPHPFIFNRPRSFASEVSGLERTEHAVHLSVGFMYVLNDDVDVLIYGGPSFFSLSQEVVGDARITETSSALTSVVVEPQIIEREDSPTGGHIGADVTYRLYERGRVKVGGGAFIRYAGASGEVRVLDTDESTSVGGFQFGFGLRTRF